MREVFVMQHVNEHEDGSENVKMIGVYSDHASAEAAVHRLSLQPGFRDRRKGFYIDAYELNKDHWAEGYGPLDDSEDEAQS